MHDAEVIVADHQGWRVAVDRTRGFPPPLTSQRNSGVAHPSSTAVIEHLSWRAGTPRLAPGDLVGDQWSPPPC